jgi:hypothetical protein
MNPDEQDQRRLLLSINHKGTILQVNTGTDMCTTTAAGRNC